MLCRRAWQRVAPLTRRVFKPATSNAAPVRRMAFGRPGGSFNTTYFVLCGGGLTAALVYAYKTINSDTERYENRLAGMGSTAKAAPAAEPVAEPEVVAEVVAESVSAPADEAVSEEAAEQQASGEAAASSEEPAPAADASSDSTPDLGEAIATETAAETQTAEGAATAAEDEGGPAPPEVTA